MLPLLELVSTVGITEVFVDDDILASLCLLDILNRFCLS